MSHGYGEPTPDRACLAARVDNPRDCYGEFQAWILRGRQYGFDPGFIRVPRAVFDKLAADPRAMAYHLDHLAPSDRQILIRINGGYDIRVAANEPNRWF